MYQILFVGIIVSVLAGLSFCTRLGYPDYTSIWTEIRAQSNDISLLVFNHSLGEVPALVEVLVTPVDGPYKGYLFKATGNGERDDDSSRKYGGVIYIYNEASVQVSAPKRNNNHDSGYALHTGDDTFWTGGSAYTSRSAYVKVRCWLTGSLPSPCNEFTNISIKTGANSPYPTFIEVNHGAGKVPDLVMVRTEATDNNAKGWFSDAQGTNRYLTTKNAERFGGVKFGYNDQKVRVWMPSEDGPGAFIFTAVDGWSLNNKAAEGILDIRVWCDLPNSKFVDSSLNIGPDVNNEQTTLSFGTQGLLLSYLDVLASITVQAQGGVNDGYVFNGIDGAQSQTANSADPCRYGGLLYSYNVQGVSVRRPAQSQGALVCIADVNGDKTGATTNGVLSIKMWELELPHGQQLCHKYKPYLTNSGLDYPDIGSIRKPSVSLCVFECNKRALCTAVKYVATEMSCTMFDTLSVGHIIPEPGSELWQRV